MSGDLVHRDIWVTASSIEDKQIKKKISLIRFMQEQHIMYLQNPFKKPLAKISTCKWNVLSLSSKKQYAYFLVLMLWYLKYWIWNWGVRWTHAGVFLPVQAWNMFNEGAKTKVNSVVSTITGKLIQELLKPHKW